MPKKTKTPSMLLSAPSGNDLLKLAEPEILKLDQERVGQILSLAEPVKAGRISAKAKKMLLSAPLKPLSLRGSDPLRLKGRRKARE